MAIKKNIAENSAETVTVEPKKENTAESKYFISDFVENPSVFNTNSIVVKTALELGGKTQYTINEAKEIVNKFKNKEVK